MKKYLVIVMLLCCFVAFAEIKRPDSYNYTRGTEAIKNKKFEEALEYLSKEVDENSDNGYAWAYIAYILQEQEDYGRALTAANRAIKKIPKKDKVFKAFAYNVRADVYYYGLDENEKALADLTTVIKETPEDIDGYERRANLYYYMDK